MSPLNDLHRKLYSHGGEKLANREKSEDEFKFDESLSSQENKNEKKGKKIKQEEKFLREANESNELPKVSFLSRFISKQNKRKTIAGAGILLFLIALGAGYVKFKQRAFSQENILIEFKGENVFRSGEVAQYTLSIQNKNLISLKNSQIKVEYPQEVEPIFADFMEENTIGSFYIDVGKIKAFEVKEYPLAFGVFSPRGSQVYLKSDFRYEPSNFSSVFSKDQSHSLNVEGSSVDFSLVSQQEASSGEAVKFIAVFTNNTDKSLDDLILELDYPKDFIFSSSTLEKIDSSANRFELPSMKSNEKLEAEIIGSFSGAVDSIKKLTGTVGVINKKGDFSKISISEEVVKVIPSRIAIEQEFFGGIDLDSKSTSLGSILKCKINFKNNSTYPLSDLILKEKIETDLIDHSSVQAGTGFYDQNKQEITWRASDVYSLKNLNPGESGSVEFYFALKEFHVPEGEINEKISTQSRISSLNISSVLPENKEISSGIEEFKVRTNLDLQISGEYGGGVFKNTGPVPLKVNEETTFTIRALLKNNFNRIDDSKLTIKLPSGIIWKDSFQRSSGSVSFNKRSNEIEWNLGSLDSQIGYKYPAEELVFQIGVTPQANQIGRDINFLNEINFKGFEKFIEKPISKTVNHLRLSGIKDYGF